MQEISFYEQFEWSGSRGAMKFWAVVDGDPIVCWIDEAALSTFAQDSDDDAEEKNVQAYFSDNLETIQAVARRIILDKHFDDEDAVSITPESLVNNTEA